MDGGVAALDRVDVEQGSLFDEPVGGATDLLGGAADALAQNLVDLDSDGGGHESEVKMGAGSGCQCNRRGSKYRSGETWMK